MAKISTILDDLLTRLLPRPNIPSIVMLSVVVQSPLQVAAAGRDVIT